jgi:predicted outer membrane repeat protein
LPTEESWITLNRPLMMKLLAPALLGFLLSTPAHALDEVVTICANEDDLRARFGAVQAAGGGTITFDCGEQTIELKNPLLISAPTTIDGGNEITLSGGGDRRVFEIATAVEATLESLDLTTAKGAIGGAILNNGDLTLRGVRVQLSQATQDGGAIATFGTLTILDGSVLSNNEAGGGGGAIYAQSAGLTRIEDSEISFNTSNGAFNGTGGAIELLDGADLQITNGTVTSNVADIGGAISALAAGSTVTIHASNISDNDTIDGAGGGILITAGVLTLTDSTIAANDAINGQGGGVMLNGVTSGSIRRSAIYGNTSTVSGGGVAIAASSGVVVENVTFSQNGALIGGGLVSGESTASIEHTTFASNVATLAGASFSNSAVSGTLTIRNTIVTDPVASANCSDDQTETTVSLGGNLSSDASCVALFDQAGDVHETDPLLGDVLADNGGPTLTYLPRPGSPVLDMGAFSVVATDQRGIERPQGTGFDIGAVEVVSCIGVVCGDANGNGSVSASDALAALRTAVQSETCALWRCDFDDSGDVQASDALAILRASVGQPVEPACPEPFDCREELG